MGVVILVLGQVKVIVEMDQFDFYLLPLGLPPKKNGSPFSFYIGNREKIGFPMPGAEKRISDS